MLSDDKREAAWTQLEARNEELAAANYLMWKFVRLTDRRDDAFSNQSDNRCELLHKAEAAVALQTGVEATHEAIESELRRLREGVGELFERLFAGDNGETRQRFRRLLQKPIPKLQPAVLALLRETRERLERDEFRRQQLEALGQLQPASRFDRWELTTLPTGAFNADTAHGVTIEWWNRFREGLRDELRTIVAASRNGEGYDAFRWLRLPSIDDETRSDAGRRTLCPLEALRTDRRCEFEHSKFETPKLEREAPRLDTEVGRDAVAKLEALRPTLTQPNDERNAVVYRWIAGGATMGEAIDAAKGIGEGFGSSGSSTKSAQEALKTWSGKHDLDWPLARKISMERKANAPAVNPTG